MAKLIARGSETGWREFALRADVVLGRAPDCDITIPKPYVSKRHARIRHLEGRHTIEDLGSSNGTEVNGRRIQKAELHDGDLISLGDCELTFAAGSEKTAADFGLELDETAATVVGVVDAGRLPTDLPDAFDTDTATKLNAHLRVLRQVSETACGALVVEDLVDRILGKLLGVYPYADHAHALLHGLGDGGRDLQLSASRAGPQEDAPRISRTLFDMASRERKAVLASDVGSDERFDAAQSIVGQGLRSMMCSPLVMGDNVLGVIQVDTTSAVHPFTVEDLQLLVTVAGQVAVAAENSRLHREALAQQRLEIRPKSPSCLCYNAPTTQTAKEGASAGQKKQAARAF